MRIHALPVALLTAVIAPLFAGGTAHAAEGEKPDAAKTEQVAGPGGTSLAGYASLKIMPTGGELYALSVYGRSWPSEVFAGNMRITFWGDDSWSDDKIWEKTASTWGDGSFSNQSFLAGISLNEDWGQDEIYATVRITDPVYGATTFKTNVVVGDY
ncbi:MAG TPA: hypothetical protein VES21_10930 [Nocardioidaceae bacterium]|nr:hypothetical protein [Nocardioidaceae bacterium]